MNVLIFHSKMNRVKTTVNKQALQFSEKPSKGFFISIEGEEFYTISEFQDLEPFFMNVVSSSDLWMFISSNGALTAGRKNPDHALFPYYPVDKIHDSSDITGSKTLIRAYSGKKYYLWEPFSSRYENVYSISRNISKNICSNKILFSETNHDLKLTFNYMWCNSEKFGFIKKSSLINLSDTPIEVELIDGFQNIMPFGFNRMMQLDKSPLVDAYKKNELLAETGIGLFTLSSVPVDRAEPSEALYANVAWSVGNDISKRLISSGQLKAFRQGKEITAENETRGKRGAYFVVVVGKVKPNDTIYWYIISDVKQTASDVISIQNLNQSGTNIPDILEEDIKNSTLKLEQIVAAADGLQYTEDKLSVYRQFSNVMFNVMRGGIFDEHYIIRRNDFIAFIKQSNTHLFNKHENWLNSLPERIVNKYLIIEAEKNGDLGLIRLCYEYMPLTFSRRHGDPSRPWNIFSIETVKDDGTKNLNYQGNWRDIFQNWEALAYSYPGFIEHMIGKFVNASTVDGYNPYRVTSTGFEWEVLDHDDPWSFIGYWGDHQIIYLLKLLECSVKFHPGIIQHFLQQDLFSYANVPYRIKDYNSILHNPFQSIDYDEALEKEIAGHVRNLGTDGKSVLTRLGEVYRVNLTEKILVSLLAKLSNFVPEGGLWMNTQRPEWNDANNALAGYGLSMVSVYYLRRYIKFFSQIIKELKGKEAPVSEEVTEQFNATLALLIKNKNILKSGFDGNTRKRFLDESGATATLYRNKVYKGFSERKDKISFDKLYEFFSLALEYIDQSIQVNKRDDNLYHAYNLLTLHKDEIEITHLQEMLEGQVAVLSSGYLTSQESITVLNALRKSAMFRADQYSYILYPDKKLPDFMNKNNIPKLFVENSLLIKKLITNRNRELIEQDENGNCHFNSTFRNKNILIEALNILSEKGYKELVEKERGQFLAIYEEMFHHKYFTGRSGSFYSYEGLGCIYWHMISKLLLATGEVHSRSEAENAGIEIESQLKEIYYDIRKGLGLNKTPAEYGAFPIDPYSHTPGHSGAQQPGMTGQVKEDIISRLFELGTIIKDGKIMFTPSLVRKEEFINAPENFSYYDISGNKITIALEAGSLAYTFCQVPVILKPGNKNQITFIKKGSSVCIEGLVVDEVNSALIFERKGEIEQLVVEITLDLKGFKNYSPILK
jgi:hypothetical protein